MTVADHPRFAGWSMALDRLVAARDDYQDAVTFKMGDRAVADAKARLRAALAAFHKISD